MQQYIEMLRAGNKTEARQHAKKYLTPHNETQSADILRAAGLLVFPPDTEAEPYKVSLFLDILSLNYRVTQFTVNKTNTIIITDDVLFSSLATALQPLYPNPSRSIVPILPSASPNCPIGWTLRPENSVLSLRVCVVIVERKFCRNLNMPYLFD